MAKEQESDASHDIVTSAKHLSADFKKKWANITFRSERDFFPFAMIIKWKSLSKTCFLKICHSVFL